MVDLLDHGYIKYIEHWGSDERIIEAARMSTDKGFLGWEPGVCPICNGTKEVFKPEMTKIVCWGCEGKGTIPGDKKLLQHMHKKKHTSPFEFGGIVLEVQAPIMVFREWHRHRTQCLAPGTLIHFESPKSLKGRRSVFKQTIEDLWEKWQPTIRNSRPERQTNAFWKRTLIQNMLLRNLNEDTEKIQHSHIIDIIKGEMKEMIRVTVISGKRLTATKEHKVYTNYGWLKLEDAIRRDAALAIENVSRNKEDRIKLNLNSFANERWEYVLGNKEYQVSTLGRIRSVNGYLTTRTMVYPGQILETNVSTVGYNYINMRYNSGNQKITTIVTAIHTLVLEAFIGPKVEGKEARHLNNNKADNRLENLMWGTSLENSMDMIKDDRQQKLGIKFEEIVLVENMGIRQSYDLVVDKPWHNFIANGFVVHNSYAEMSARYTPLLNVDYVPSTDRLLIGSDGKNKQAGTVKGSDILDLDSALEWQAELADLYEHCEKTYQSGLQRGVPKELARLALTVGRYSRMRAQSVLLNWLRFLTLRMAPDAQWEIRQYANEVGKLVEQYFPRTWALFHETFVTNLSV